MAAGHSDVVILRSSPPDRHFAEAEVGLLAMSSMPPPPPAFAAAGSGSARRAGANPPDADLGVIETNDEASGAKACCVSRGYFDDPFVKHFARRVPKHPPLINRGYHARVATVRAVLDAFLDATFDADRAEDAATSPGGAPVAGAPVANVTVKKRQIVSLGAGFDASYFRLRTKDAPEAPSVSLAFVEIDHAVVIATKAAVVNATATLRASCVGGVGVRRFEDGEENGVKTVHRDGGVLEAFVDGGGYAMCGCDLRDPSALDTALNDVAGLDPNVPTLFLSECCLAYLEAEEASEVLRWAASWGEGEGEGKSLDLKPPPLRAYFAYDPSLIGDANDSKTNESARDRFGEQMLLNLRARGCPLLGAEKTRGVAKHVERARRNGWEIAGAVDMLAASKRLAYENPSESRRVAFIEPLDELEEYELIQAHYVVSWGVRGADDDAARLERVVDRSA
jgi:hypothetical protein